MLNLLLAGVLNTGAQKTVINVPENYTVYISAYINERGDTLSLGSSTEFLDSFSPTLLRGDLCLSRPLNVVPYLGPMDDLGEVGLTVYGESFIKPFREDLLQPIGFTGIGWNTFSMGPGRRNAYFLWSGVHTMRTTIAQKATNYLYALNQGDWSLSDKRRDDLVNAVKNSYEVNSSDYGYLDGLEDGDWVMGPLTRKGVPLEIRDYVDMCLDTFPLK